MLKIHLFLLALFSFGSNPNYLISMHSHAAKLSITGPCVWWCMHSVCLRCKGLFWREKHTFICMRLHKIWHMYHQVPVSQQYQDPECSTPPLCLMFLSWLFLFFLNGDGHLGLCTDAKSHWLRFMFHSWFSKWKHSNGGSMGRVTPLQIRSL